MNRCTHESAHGYEAQIKINWHMILDFRKIASLSFEIGSWAEIRCLFATTVSYHSVLILPAAHCIILFLYYYKI